RDEPSTRLSTLRTQLDHVVARGKEIQVVLDENHRRASPLQLPQHAEEHQDVTAMEPHRGLVEQEERPLGAALRELPRELQPLDLAAAPGRERLAHPEIAKADPLQHPERFLDV